jgi:photosystem II stability/assembly factor-like uncharacterized protein
MKRTPQLLVLLLLLHNGVFAQMNWMNPQPSGYPDNKIIFVNDSTGYLMNSNGDLFVTTDTGSSWHSKGNFPGASTFQLKGSTGIIPSSDGSLYLSIDNGINWQKANNSPGAGGFLAAWAAIASRDTLFVLKGVNNFLYMLYKSVDRGQSWQLINNNINQFTLKTFDFVNSSVGYTARADGIYKTTDGGVTWNLIYSVTNSNNVIAVKFSNALNGFAYRENIGMLKTTDGGLSWPASPLPSLVYDIFIVDPNNAFAVGELGIIYSTTNTGNTWNSISPPLLLNEYDLYTQFFFTPSTGIVAGLRGRILKTINAGSSWKSYSPTYTDVTAISFPTDSIAYATTWNNVYKTQNAGRSWDSLPLPAGNPFPSIRRYEQCRFTSKDTGFVTVNTPAKIYKTTNGGQNWTLINPTPANYANIPAMSFFSKDTGYMIQRDITNPNVGKGLFKTVNGGNIWQEVGSSQDFDKINFLNNLGGYATRFDKIYRTVDGGNTWTQLITFDFVQLTSLWFINPSKGFITASQGYLNMTADSGQTWNHVQVDPNLPNFVAIKFYNNKVGYITDDAGRIFKSTNGGTVWKPAGNVAYYSCPSILFGKDTTVVFGGKYGSIVSLPIGEYAIDSLQAIPSLCGADFSGLVTSIVSKVDSIYFEYGVTTYTYRAIATPSFVSDTTVRVSFNAGGLSADSLYKVRIKILFRGKYYYSNEITFRPLGISQPVITAVGNVLSSSSVSGNQWYLDGFAINGATNQQYTATVSGSYTVKVTLNGCSSVFSNPYIVSITGIINVNGPGLPIIVYPNPVLNDMLNINVGNQSNLYLNISDVLGRAVLNKALQRGSNTISLAKFEKGIYVLKFTDIKSGKNISTNILKL